MHYVTAKGILSAKNGMNLYRGCQHGCIYCDSRSECYHMDHDFEDIEVKENALVLLEDALRRKRKPCMIGTGSMSDPYMPLEDELQYTQKALELIHRYGFGATLITKSDRVLRDLDLLKAIHDKTKCVVQMTLTTYDEELCRKLEPGVCTTKARFEALKTLRDAGIPTVVWLCPILPFINDTPENISGILDYCEEAQVKGIICFGMGVTLRAGNREYFYRQLARHFPGLKAEYTRRYGDAYMLDSPRSRELMNLFHRRCQSAGILHDNDRIFQYLSQFEEKTMPQMSLFEGGIPVKDECLICKAPLEYLVQDEMMECAICHKKELSKTRCVKGHYVCSECHTQGMDSIFGLCLSETSTDPIEIVRKMMDLPFCHMHGPEHHVMVGAALLTAYKNAGGELELESALREMYGRGKQVPGGACGFWGACGAGISAGQFMAIATQSTPLAKEPWGLSNQMTSKALGSIGEVGGPRCCKRDSYLAILAAIDFTKEQLGVEMTRTIPACSHSAQNNQCIGKCCLFRR